MKPFQCFGTVPYSTEKDPKADEVLNGEDGSGELAQHFAASSRLVTHGRKKPNMPDEEPDQTEYRH